jgi:hypothetical protein
MILAVTLILTTVHAADIVCDNTIFISFEGGTILPKHVASMNKLKFFAIIVVAETYNSV